MFDFIIWPTKQICAGEPTKYFIIMKFHVFTESLIERWPILVVFCNFNWKEEVGVLGVDFSSRLDVYKSFFQKHESIFFINYFQFF